MDSPKSLSSPVYRNIKSRKQDSPIELKEKIRKDYRQKFKNSRLSLINNLRGLVNEDEIRNTINKMYGDIFKFSEPSITDEEAQTLVDEIKKELVQEELKWCIDEYEKSQIENFDWSAIDNDDVICPVCQKVNLLFNTTVSCNNCKWDIKTSKTKAIIKNDITSALEQHNSTCNNIVQFTPISDNDTHIFLICSSCTEMQFIV